MKITLKPTLKQHEAWSALSNPAVRILMFGGGAGGGKTWLGCEWLLTNCYQFPHSRWFIARNELKRLMNSTFVTFQKVARYHKIPKEDWNLDGKYNVIRFKNGSTIDLLDVAYSPGDDDYERFGSLEYNGGFGEEAGEWHFKAFDVLKTRVGRHTLLSPEGHDITPPAKMYLTCNPSQSWVRNVFYKPWKTKSLRDGYAFIQSLYLDNPYTSKSYAVQLNDVIDESMKRRLRDGDWEYEDPNGLLMKFENITDIFTNTVDVLENDLYISVDVARFGSDKVVINLWKSLESVKRYTYSHQDTVETARIVRDIAAEYRVPYSHIVVDDDGVGGGVSDMLKGVVRFVANSAPLNVLKIMRKQYRPDSLSDSGSRTVNFYNLKSQCSWLLAELVETHRIAVRGASEIEKEELSAELSMIRNKNPDSDAKLQVVPKEEVKALLGRSPDYADTFVMRMIFELKKNAKGSAEFGDVHKHTSSLHHNTSPQTRSVRAVAL